jgi:hypothetical protein
MSFRSAIAPISCSRPAATQTDEQHHVDNGEAREQQANQARRYACKGREQTGHRAFRRLPPEQAPQGERPVNQRIDTENRDNNPKRNAGIDKRQDAKGKAGQSPEQNGSPQGCEEGSHGHGFGLPSR